MQKEGLEHYKHKLLKERSRVYKLLHQLEANEAINSTSEISSELSFYDNHPSDIGSEIFDMERGIAFKEHEISIIKKINDSLDNIESGTYGICQRCGKAIPRERLEFIPYAEFCVGCQQQIYDSKPKEAEKNNRPIEEEVLGQPFGYGFNDFDDVDYEVEFDAEDSYERVQMFDWIENVQEDFIEDDSGVGFVEPIEKISNQQYKNQLPD